jgi:alpha-glucosidase
MSEIPWWRGAVVYQVYIRSFYDSDGDGQGDLPGVEAKLDYIRDLGVDAIWLSPIHPSPNLDWGYDIADYAGIQSDYGSMADFERLLAAAHDRGIRVLLDEVLAHTSDQHAWFRESIEGSEKRDWYVWADGRDGGPPNNWIATFGGPAWSFNEARGQWYHHKFMPQQPKLNWQNREARRAALGVLDFWLSKGVDGFRLDVANALTHDTTLADNETAPDGEQIHRHEANRPDNIDALDEVRRLVESHGADRFVFGEFFEEPELSGGYAPPGEGVHSAYTFPLMLEAELGPDFIRHHFEGALAANPGHWPSVAFSNHDVKRVLTRFGGEDAPPELARMMLAVLISLRGTVLLYQGEELGLPQADVAPEDRRDPIRAVNRMDVGRDGARTPMPWGEGKNLGFSTADKPWLPPSPQHAGLTVAAEEADPGSTLALARDLIAARKTSAALRLGEIAFQGQDQTTLQFTRTWKGETLHCAFNMSNEPRRLFPGDGSGATMVGPFGFRIEGPGILIERGMHRG